jgi:histidyl-tRNA synthetase
MGVEYELDDTLVRGLDYYAEVVFEVHAISKEGKDYGALLGGGHYEGLLETFGGPKDIDYGVGFGMGLERVYSLMADNKMLDDVKSGVDIFAMPVGAEVVDDAFSLVEQIRALGYSVEMPFVPSKLGSMFKKAERSGAKFALIIGPEELARGMVNLKNLDNKEQKEVAIETLDETLDAEFEKLENPEHEHGEGCTCGHCHD